MKTKDNTNHFSNYLSLVSFILVIMTVIYSTDNYDIWDFLTSFAILFGLIKFRKDIILNHLHSVTIFRIGTSICFSVLLLSLFALFFDQPNPSRITSNTTGRRLLHFFDMEFLLSTLVFLISLLVRKKILIK